MTSQIKAGPFEKMEQPAREFQLSVFLCHSSSDKTPVRELYQRLRDDGFRPWLDAEELLPGQDWQLEIRRAIKRSGVVLVCLSRSSITKTGFAQREIRMALDVAYDQPEGAVFIIPLKLEECDIPDRLNQWPWVNIFDENGYEMLTRALRRRAETLKG